MNTKIFVTYFVSFITKLRIQLFFGSLFLISCASTQEQTEVIVEEEVPQTEETKKEHPSDRYRNLESDSLRKFTSQGGPKIEILASQAPESASVDKTVKIRIPIGSQKPIQCNIVKTKTNSGKILANALHQIQEKSAESFEIFDYKAGLVKDIPYFYAIYDYILPNKEFGNYKVGFIHKTGQGNIICIHDEPGYTRTFEKVLKSLAGSDFLSRYFPDPGRFQSKSLYLIYLNERPIGFYELYTFRESSDLTLSVTDSLEMNVQEKTFRNVIQWKNIAYTSAISGEIIQLENTKYQNGILMQKTRLLKLDKGKYKSEGKSGESFSKTIYTSLPLLDTEAAIFRLMRLRKKSDVKELQFAEFLPAHPQEFSESKITLNLEKGERLILTYDSSLGLSGMKIEAGKSGIYNLHVKSGDLTVEIKRGFYKSN